MSATPSKIRGVHPPAPKRRRLSEDITNQTVPNIDTTVSARLVLEHLEGFVKTLRATVQAEDHDFHLRFHDSKQGEDELSHVNDDEIEDDEEDDSEEEEQQQEEEQGGGGGAEDNDDSNENEKEYADAGRKTSFSSSLSLPPISFSTVQKSEYHPRYVPATNHTDYDDDDYDDEDDEDDEIAEAKREQMIAARKQFERLTHYEDDEEVLYAVRVKLFEYVVGPDDRGDYYASHLYKCNNDANDDHGQDDDDDEDDDGNGKMLDHIDSNKEDTENDPRKANVATTKSPSPTKKSRGRWIMRGTGIMKFLKHMEEGITYGIVRLVMSHEGTLRTLANHNLEPHVEAKKMTDRKGRTMYIWRTKDHAEPYLVYVRTFAVKFSSERDAMEWHQHFEQGKRDTARARLGYDVADTSAGDEMATFMNQTLAVRIGTSPPSLLSSDVNKDHHNIGHHKDTSSNMRSMPSTTLSLSNVLSPRNNNSANFMTPVGKNRSSFHLPHSARKIAFPST